ncbi:CDP-alcohol phosphatidyltransferase family protein [Quadrisphaera sp. KR29]|uniref:CDP-alcohol phosphatidyltransferase family protein n=1 Tax=Quadrisphaera sp. KR29 TaxID=3461391 RepID=UPI0040445341
MAGGAREVTREEHLRRWSAAHGGTAASPLVRAWLGGVRAVASPLAAAGVRPSAITVVGLLLALVALVPAAAQVHAGGRWALLVPLLLAAAALADGLDGAVAVLGGTASRSGAVLDAACDRLADAAALGVLWLLGAPALPVLVALGAGQLHEYVRARAQAEGMAGPGAVTVSERPTRVAVAAMFALGCGTYPQVAATWAGVGAWAAAVAALVGLLQLLVAVRRSLPSQ